MDNLPHYGYITKQEIATYVKDPMWQKFRLRLKGLSTKDKIILLRNWVEDHNNSRDAQVQVTNYVNALKRGGQIK